MEDNDNDYKVRFLLNLMEACCMKEELTGIICRVLFNYLTNSIRDDELKYTEKLQDIAFNKLVNIRTEMLFDFVEKMKLTERVTPEFYKVIAQAHLKEGRFHEAALIIYKFKFHKDFDCLKIIEQCAITERLSAAKQLCELDESYKGNLINLLSTNEHCKIA